MERDRYYARRSGAGERLEDEFVQAEYVKREAAAVAEQGLMQR
jgi:hypothetical protein